MGAEYIGLPLLDLLENSTTYYTTSSSLSPNVDREIINILIPTGKIFICMGGSAFGNTDAEFKYYINSNAKEVLVNNWCERNVKFGVREKVIEGNRIRITVKHWSTNMWDFHASVFGVLI